MFSVGVVLLFAFRISSCDYYDDLSGLSASIYCKFQPIGYDCAGLGLFKPRFYYDLKMKACATRYVDECPHNKNVFSSLTNCEATCRDVALEPLKGNFTAKIYCRFQQDFGECNEYHPRWYYDMTTRTCQGFSYSGCGGNLNNFHNVQKCNDVCGDNNF